LDLTVRGSLIVIHANPRTPMSRDDLSRPPHPQELRDGVGGDIEIIPRFERFEGQPCVAFCDKHGKHSGKPFNQRATALWLRQFRTKDYLAGDIVIVTRDERP
jgi:hypothetical protein